MSNNPPGAPNPTPSDIQNQFQGLRVSAHQFVPNVNAPSFQPGAYQYYGHMPYQMGGPGESSNNVVYPSLVLLSIFKVVPKSGQRRYIVFGQKGDIYNFLMYKL